MANNDRASLMIVLPRGVAVFPKLNKPDTKFAPEGSYETKVEIAPTSDDAVIGKKSVTQAQLIEALEEMRDAFLVEKKAELAANKDPKQKAKAKSITARSVGEPAYDDDGEENGNLVVKAKMKASGVSPKDGKPWTRKPNLFDAANKPMDIDGPAIYGGSVIKVAAKAVPYYMAAENFVGIALYLEAVQVLELVTGGGRTASAYGFGTEEGGFVAEEGGSQFSDTSAEAADDSDDF
jgi:hypothetical protein